MKERKFKGWMASPAFWLAAAGVLCVFVGDLRTSAGFLAAAVGCCLLVAAWLVWLFYKGRQTNLTPKQKHWLNAGKVITITVIVIGIIILIILEGLILSEVHGTEEPQADILIVLGAGLHGETPSATLQVRLDAALEQLLARPKAVAVLSGGQGHNETITEAKAMARYLTARGIEPSRLYLEEQARNTEQNLRFSREIIEENHLEGSIAVVSNGFHLYRAKHLAERMGMEVETVSAPVPYAWLIPSVYLREACSLLLMFAKEILG